MALFTGRFDVQPGKWTTPANQFALNAWTNLIVTYEPAEVLAVPIIYIGGVSQVLNEIQAPAGALRSEVGVPLSIGNYKASTVDYSKPSDGLIKDTRGYNVILSQAEATSLAAGGNVTRGMVFQGPCVRTKELADFGDLVLTADKKMIDNMFGMVGTPNNSVTTRLIP